MSGARSNVDNQPIKRTPRSAHPAPGTRLPPTPPRRALFFIHPDSKSTAPNNTVIMVINRVSEFRMWLISCAMTPCNSSRLSISSRPVMTTIELSVGTAPMVKALGSESFTTYNVGGGSPAARLISFTTSNNSGRVAIASSGCSACTDQRMEFFPQLRLVNIATIPMMTAKVVPTGRYRKNGLFN